MQGSIGRAFTLLRSWLGGFRLLLLILLVLGVVGGLWWEQRRHPIAPPNATNVTAQLSGDIRQTTFWFPGSGDDLRAFYKQELPQRGWSYCGTQETPNCTNMISLVNGSGSNIDVYRRNNDVDFRGATIEVWPVRSEGNQTYVTIFETRNQ